MNEELEKDMTPLLIEDLGMRYATERSLRKYRYGLYECQYCGKEFEANSNNIKVGNIKGCGCQRKGINKTHGLCNNKFYNTWRHMVGRCNNPKNKNYKDYGGRGIIVCEEWLDVRNFIAWAEATHPNIEGVSLDRIDNDKGYPPENCTWSDKTTQVINQRMKKSNTSGYRGVSWHKAQNRWIAQIGIGNKLIYLGCASTALEAAKLYETYVRENGLEHNYTPSLSIEEINILNKIKEGK